MPCRKIRTRGKYTEKDIERVVKIQKEIFRERTDPFHESRKKKPAVKIGW